VSLLTETARVTGIVAILFLTGTLRVFHRHGRAIHGNLLETFARALFSLAAVAVIVTSNFRFNGAVETVGESLALALVWGAFVLLLPAPIIPWVRARSFTAIRAHVRNAFVRTVQMSLSTGLLTWVFLVVTDRGRRLLDFRLFIAASFAVIGALQLARLARVPLPPGPPEPTNPERDRVPVG